MKNHLIALSITIMAAVTAHAQTVDQFKLTTQGFINATDTTKNFIVVDMPDKSQQDLYKRSLVYFSGLYVSPKEVISSVDNESITINGVTKNAFKMKVLYLNPSWDVNYTFNILFKNGKIRISEPVINRMVTQTGNITRTATINPGSGEYNKEIFNRKGVLKQEQGKVNLEVLINKYIADYVSALASNKQDNW